MSMERRSTICACAAVAFATATCSGGTTFFDFLLDGQQEVPANVSTSFGFATVAYDDVEQTFDIELFTDGIGLDDLRPVGPNGTPIHLHMAPAGSNGPIVIDLGLVGSFSDLGDGILEFAATDIPIGGDQGAIGMTDPIANETALFAGGLYLNIHTNAFPSGEIRGQVIPSPSAGLLLLVVGGITGQRRRRSAV